MSNSTVSPLPSSAHERHRGGKRALSLLARRADALYMATKEISEEQFSERAVKHPATIMLLEELAWWGVDSDTVMGAVVIDKTDRDYGWVVVGPDPVGQWRAIEVQGSLQTQDAATEALRAKLKEYEASGETCWEQD